MPTQPAMLALTEFIGGSEMVVIFLLILMLFGGQKMPELARGLGKAVREFKKATSGVEEEIKKALAEPHETAKSNEEAKPTPKPENPPAVPPPGK